MKSIQTYLSGALLLSLFACSDVLDVRDASLINPAIWDSEQSATLYINNLYNEMPASTIISSSSNPFGAHAQFTDETLGSNKYVNGEYTYSDIAVFNDTYYGKIRRINIALEKMETSSLAGDAYNRIVGQAYFLRAWAYWNLVAVYGGVPYITRSVNPYVDDSTTLDPPRNKTSECISYLCDDLDDAIATLPASVTAYQNGTSQYARVTRAAAAALKGRILLFYASPQFNPTNNPARWEAAYQANRFADSLAKADGYALMVGTTDPLTGAFASIFLTEGNQNKEVLFSKAYDVSVSRTHGWENAVRPYVAGLSGGMTCNPSWELVKAFPMSNGMATNEVGSGFDSTYYWKNRDPRFYATIAYNGCTWPLTGMAGTRIWTHKFSNTEKTNGTTTGFYCRKMTNASIDKNVSDKCGTDWVEIRYAEVILNLAECANETGRQTETLTLLKAIRARAGILEGDGNYGLKTTYPEKEELTALIMNERMVEFAFENKRLWDMRRRQMFTHDLGSYKKLNGRKRWLLETDLKYPSGVITPAHKTNYVNNTLIPRRDTIDLDNRYTVYFINKFSQSIGDVNYPINVPERYDFFGIPQMILNRSKAIKQTKGWGSGTDEFDPYE